MVVNGCLAYLAFVRDVGIDTPTVESVLVVTDFPDIFPVDVPVMPPDRDIDFGIDLLRSQEEHEQHLRFVLQTLREKKLYANFSKSEIYICNIVDLHGVLVSIISDWGTYFWRVVQGDLGTRVELSTTFHPQKDGQSDCTIQILEDMLRAWFEMGEARLLGTDLVWDALEKVKLIQDRIGTAQFRQKSYVDQKFWDVAYMMYYGDSSHVLDFSTVQLDVDLTYDVEPMAILDRQVQKLRSKKIASVKVQ
ncbi:uncharacterized protein [Nicotiana tomentosiformis]|uniref:uncharacterized protein n=1 Tax=Nicotiana tomentosiformis TaxID=4098 RepID=UPI00388CAECB